MKILIVSYVFAPYNVVGSVRVSKLAAHLLRQGHDVRVLTADRLAFPTNLTVDFPDHRVVRTRWVNVNAPMDWARTRVARRAGGGTPQAQGLTLSGGGMSRRLVDGWRLVTNLPDGQAGWYPFAVAAGKRLLREWTPEVVFSSALPFTCHLVARRLSDACGAAWTAEYRDLFTDNPYLVRAAWREALDARLESRVVGSAAGFVTVSGPLAESLERRFAKPVQVILNGYDPEDFADLAPPPVDAAAPLSILYTGIIYPGRRDPTPLFQALARLGPDAAHVEIRFAGQDLRGVAEAAAAAGVADSVRFLPLMSYAEAQQAQAATDALLLLLWDDPRERGIFTGKLFEYIGAGRPVLTVGSTTSAAGALAEERRLGPVTKDPQVLADWLRARLDEKRRTGTIAGPDAAARSGLTRTEQFAVLEDFMATLSRAAKRPG